MPVAALIPARNEGPRVGAVVRDTSRYVDRVLVVVNGSSDDTAQQAQAAGAELAFSPPGYAQALASGYRALQGCTVVQMDADGQHPADAIPTLLAALRRGADLVVGSRYLGNSGYRIPASRRLGTWSLRTLSMALGGPRVLDVFSGLRALSPLAVERLGPDFPQDVADARLLLRASRRGLQVVEVPVPMRARDGGVSMHQGPAAALNLARSAWCLVREGR